LVLQIRVLFGRRKRPSVRGAAAWDLARSARAPHTVDPDLGTPPAPCLGNALAQREFVLPDLHQAGILGPLVYIALDRRIATDVTIQHAWLALQRGQVVQVLGVLASVIRSRIVVVR
jgi:hypothetical protein